MIRKNDKIDLIENIQLTGQSQPQRDIIYKTGAPSQADVDRPDPQEVLVSKEGCLQFYR